jgi:MFS family permease
MKRGKSSPVTDPSTRRTCAAFTAAACALGIAFVGSNLPTPLYPVYQARWHFSAGIVTIVFAAYSLGLIVALLGVGRLSDQLGRRRVLVPSLALLVVASLIFLFAPSVAWLILARVSQGLGVGAIAATASAALADYEPTDNRKRAALAASMATAIGLALGPLIGSILVDVGPRSDLLIWGLYVVPVVGVMLAVQTTMQEGSSNRGIRFRLQQISVPRTIITPFLTSTGTFVCGWVATALFVALGPTFVISSLKIENRPLGGLVGSLVFAASALSQVTVHRLASRERGIRSTMTLGSTGLVIGLAICVLALFNGSIAIFLGGVLLVGSGQGISYFASLAALNVVTPPARRSEIMAAYYLAGYLSIALAIPAVGFASTRIGLPAACSGFTVGVAVLAAASGTISYFHSPQTPRAIMDELR